MNNAITLLGRLFFLKRPESEEKTAGGFFLPCTAKEKPQESEALALGAVRDALGNSNATSEIPARRSRVLFASVLALWSVGTIGAQQVETGLATPEDEDEDVFVLSPFEVNAGEDTGYRATHTLSGSRMNTKLSDLAASITVVTAQQLEDTGSIDVNDVFMYESNTEGTYQYTQFATDAQGSFSATGLQQSPQTANRVRGIGSPDRAVDYFVGLSEIPQDAYNIDRVDINRGPNSVLYGLGSAAGLINVSQARAYIGTDTNRVNMRIGSWDEFRSDFSVNRTLIDDKLAIRVAGLYHDRGYPQEPNHDYTRRFYGTVTYKPFEMTNIRAYYEKYNTDYARPGGTTPQDYISHWIAAGRPTFNPSTMMVTHNGRQIPIMTADASELAAASGTGLINHPHNTRAPFYTEDGVTFAIRMPRQLGTGADGGGASQPQPERMVTSAGYQAPAGYGNWFVPGVHDKSIYDWEKINLRAANMGNGDADSYQLVVEQQLMDNLFVEFGWRREDFTGFQTQAYRSGNDNVFIDVNETYVDGTPNPGFLKPYMEGWEPSATTSKRTNDSTRLSVAYELDFTETDGWRRWLGRHSVMGFGERRSFEDQDFDWREAVISEHSWSGDPGAIHFTGQNLRDRMNRVWYLGDNAQITKSGGAWPFAPPGIAGRDYPEGVVGPTWNQTLRLFDATVVDGIPQRDASRAAGYGVPGGPPVGTWSDHEAVTATILREATSSQTTIDTQALVLQSYLWDDRIIGTLGRRSDTRKQRNSGTIRSKPVNEFGFLHNIPEHLNDFPEWDEVEGTTYSKGVVVYPFANWSGMPEFLHGFTMHYNESDTFQPAGLAVNRFDEVLPMPTGEGKDYGFGLSLLDDKLHLRVNWYEAGEQNTRNITQAGRVIGRVPRMDHEPELGHITGEPGWGNVKIATRQVEMRRGVPRETWDIFTGYDAIPADIRQEIATEAGFDSPEIFLDWAGKDSGKIISDTAAIASEGMEISLDYNPTQNWSLKFTAGRQETIEPPPTAPATQRWLFGEGGTLDNPQPGGRLHHWQNYEYIDVRDLPADYQPGDSLAGIPTRRWWDEPDVDGHTMPEWGFSPHNWYNTVVQGILQVALENEGLSNPQVREWRWSALTNYRFTEGVFKNFSVGGSARWEDKGAIGYLARPENPQLLDGSRPVFDDDRYYFDFWTSYTKMLMEDRVAMKVQLNLRDAFRSPGLRGISVNSDGSTRGYRIENGRQWILSTSFEF